MGVVTLSSSASRTSLGLSANFTTHRNTQKRSVSVAFQGGKSNNIALVTPHEQTYSPVEAPKQPRKKKGKNKKLHVTVKSNAVSIDEYSSSAMEVDYNEAAAKLESIYKLNVADDPAKVEDIDGARKRGWRRRQKFDEGNENKDGTSKGDVVRNQKKKSKRLSLDTRIALRRKHEEEVVVPARKQKSRKNELERIDELVREYSGSTDSLSLDWKRMKIPKVLSSSEHSWLFKLMQPMKALLQVKDNFSKGLGREPTEGELAEATNLSTFQIRRQIEVGRAARNKLIKHNLRLVLFTMNKYFQDFANGPKFQDLCQAGAMGLITAIDRFEPRRKFRLSTYSLFWIRHAIIRSMTVSSFVRVPFSFESVRMEIHRAKQELTFELQRPPTEEEIIKRVGISPERYHEVIKASKPVLSLNARNATTNEELIDGITDVDGVNADNGRRSALIRLALDDVLDSLKPKESLVIRQRYGLDGKGDRTLGEIAGNLSISREMVRKHEVKAFMKLKHPARVDYLRRYLV